MLRTVCSRSVRAVAIPTKPAYRDLDPETRELYKKIIRVDHAGERGADVIYNDTVFFMFPRTGESMFSDQRSRRESPRVPKCSLGSDLWRRDTEQMSMSRDL